MAPIGEGIDLAVAGARCYALYSAPPLFAVSAPRPPRSRPDLEGVAEEAVEHADLERVEHEREQLALSQPLEHASGSLRGVQHGGHELGEEDDGETDGGVAGRLGVREQRAHGETDEEADERDGEHAKVALHAVAQALEAGLATDALTIALLFMSFASMGVNPGLFMFFFMFLIALGWTAFDPETLDLTFWERVSGEGVGVAIAMLAIVFLQRVQTREADA